MLLLLLLVVCLELSPIGGLEVDFRRGLGAFFHGGWYEGNKVSKSQDLRYFLSMKCRWVVYAANSYHRVVDLPFGEMRGFEATTYRPWSLKVGLMSRLYVMNSYVDVNDELHAWEGKVGLFVVASYIRLDNLDSI